MIPSRRLLRLQMFVPVVLLLWIAGAAAVAQQTRRGKPFSGRIGLELYSVRDLLKKDVPKTLAMVRKMGFRHVEVPDFYGLTAAQFRRELDRAGLKPASVLFPYERLQNDLAGVAADARALRVRYVVVAWIPHQGKFSRPDADRAAADFNRWGEALARQGLRFTYHIHGYEFQPAGDGTLFDVLMKSTRPQWVSIEMDVFWVVHPGQDPVRLLENYPGRFVLMHLKDMRRGTPVGDLSGHAPLDTNVAIGSGQIDFAPILRAASRAGILYCYIEDESARAVEQIPESLRYLRSLRF